MRQNTMSFCICSILLNMLTYQCVVFENLSPNWHFSWISLLKFEPFIRTVCPWYSHSCFWHWNLCLGGLMQTFWIIKHDILCSLSVQMKQACKLSLSNSNFQSVRTISDSIKLDRSHAVRWVSMCLANKSPSPESAGARLGLQTFPLISFRLWNWVSRVIYLFIFS